MSARLRARPGEILIVRRDGLGNEVAVSVEQLIQHGYLPRPPDAPPPKDQREEEHHE